MQGEREPFSEQKAEKAFICLVCAAFYLLAAGVELLLHQPPRLWNVALLHQGEIVGVLQGHLQVPLLSLLQGTQEVLRETPCKEGQGHPWVAGKGAQGVSLTED